jgi:hypothetical protein
MKQAESSQEVAASASAVAITCGNNQDVAMSLLLIITSIHIAKFHLLPGGL